MKSFCACLTLAANDDERITNRSAWRIPALRDATKARNVVLTEPQVRAVVAASYEAGGDCFGVFVELLATTGARPSQVRRLTVSDLEDDHADGPRVQMPSSRKGRGKKRIERTPLPIPAGLATRLKAEAAGRADDELLLRDDQGHTWVRGGHSQLFPIAAVAAGLPKNVTAYALRHTSITRSLLKNIPVRLVAAAHDTSAAMIEATYSKHIAHPGADLVRAALLDFDPPAPAPDANKVVPLTRSKTG